jgi:hypothetical protein
MTITKLLHHMSSFFPGVKLTAKTIKQQEVIDVTITPMHFGRYAHFNNWQTALRKQLEAVKFAKSHINIIVNVDGIPLFNDSRKYHAYPILLQISFKNMSKIICVGVYLSESEKSNKMPDVDLFLHRFVEEMSNLITAGIYVNNNKVSVIIKSIVCDAPARSDLKRIVNHNSYNSCERCIQKGTYAGGHVALLDTHAPLRNDADFKNKINLEHHKTGPTPIISEMGIGFVTSFALDYMHLVCIGVMKRLLNRWKNSRKAETKCHLSVDEMNSLEMEIKEFSEHITSEFGRKLSGGIHSLAFWKASELRLFLLYAGIVVLNGIIPKRNYINFLNLCIPLRLMLTPNQEQNIGNARSMLLNFVDSSRRIYGNSFVSYNVHNIIHLPDDYMKWGPLSNVSCFPFESYLGAYIKGRLSGRNKPLEQICRHVSTENERIIMREDKTGVASVNKFYQGTTVFKCGPVGGRDNCILLKSGKIGIIKTIKGDKISVDIYNKTSYFNEPVDSQKVGIYKLEQCIENTEVSQKSIFSKMMLVPKDNFFVSISLLHKP